ncbi:unnamed protein product [Ceratitis capitata]|uniref:(Mediterranean fruit fly) hypothetical protein n=1 Tax=Ceratitis capitata TaxID=7213 RepID=A0A811UWA8_CERCA|nr:unnamed protein product [Ceratitis capitata]
MQCFQWSNSFLDTRHRDINGEEQESHNSSRLHVRSKSNTTLAQGIIANTSKTVLYGTNCPTSETVPGTSYCGIHRSVQYNLNLTTKEQ